MKVPSREQIERIKQQYPTGTRIKLNSMEDPYAPVDSGTFGTVKAVDDMGTLFVDWDNGRSFGVIVGEDSFTVLNKPQEAPCLETLKFYSPLVIMQEPLDEYGYPTNSDYEPIDPDFNLLSCEEAIRESLERENRHLDPARGLMEYYDGPDSLPSVREKVKSLFFDIEEHGGTLWGVTEAKISTPLTEEETASLLDYAEGQMSDGLGEGWEQRPINTPEGEIYVSLWNPDNFQMIPEAEFEPEQYQNYDYSGDMKLY